VTNAGVLGAFLRASVEAHRDPAAIPPRSRHAGARRDGAAGRRAAASSQPPAMLGMIVMVSPGATATAEPPMSRMLSSFTNTLTNARRSSPA
jgi:hypothetical protein